MFGRCLWIAAGWAAGKDGGDCKVKRRERWPWEIQSEGEIGLPSLKGDGSGCFHPDMYIQSWRQGGFQSVFQNQMQIQYPLNIKSCRFLGYFDF